MAKTRRKSPSRLHASPGHANVSLADILQDNGFVLVRANIGEGGSAYVHEATANKQSDRVKEGQRIAIKEYKQSVLEIPGQIDRIRQEADLGESLRHPNVVKTFGLISPEEGNDSRYFLLLEWIDGQPLDQWYRRDESPPPWGVLQRISLDIIEAVTALHERGVFHRDIKPENVMVRGEDSAVLMDVGVAELTGNNAHTLHTSVKDFVGSVRFASPQFILGESFAAADDVYSIGVTLYLLFTGRVPYEEVERKPVLPIRVVTAPPKIESLQTDVPKPMKIVLQACCHRDRDRRPSLEELADCIRNPSGSTFITRELERQAQESRSYVVLKVISKGGEFFADLAGDISENGLTFDVVRHFTAIHVPSYNRKITPEVWVAEAVLKHSHQNIGHFKVIGKRWQQAKPPRFSPAALSADFVGTPGHWVEYEKIDRAIEPGDLVLKSSESD